jgi:PKD repeat protein/C1A family cysteine protease
MWVGILAVVVIFGFGFAGSVFGKDDNDPHKTGLRAPTQEELNWQNKHMKRVKKVKLNQIGLERINHWRQKKGLRPVSEKEAGLVEKGKEIEGTIGSLSEESAATGSPVVGLPTSVDNSALIYFPPIRSQGSIGSCACFSSTYYTMTYMYAWQKGINAKTGDDTTRFSPKWTYNMINEGKDSGSWFTGAYNIALKNGPATWAEFPYDANYRQWCLDKTVWRNAINRRFDQTGYISDVRQNSGIQTLKELLNNGYILNFATYVNSWQWKTIGNDPGTPADDAFAGKSCAYWVNGTAGGHGMTVVGYNDDIWVDINGNGAVDSGEKGAFRIANSWGTGWGEGGFCWFAYDGLKPVSGVSGGPGVNRKEGWWYGQAYWITPRNYLYQPTMVAEFTLNHLKRSQLRMTLGVSDKTRATPSTIWSPAMIYGQGGPYAFDGTTTAIDGTFVMDFTDIAPAGFANEYRYYVGMYDGAAGDAGTLLSFKLIDVLNGNIETVCYDVPKVADASQAYAYVDYCYDDGNLRPVAIASALPLSGNAPLLVQFDGSGSYDMDGGVVSYAWNFGDGTGGSGVSAGHTYASAGAYTATLTVTDNRGATGQESLMINVSPDPAKIVYVYDIVMSYTKTRTGKTAKAVVTIQNASGGLMPGMTVSGSWSGVVTGSASVKTGADGKATFISKKTTRKGKATFTVTKVSATGFTYDASRNNKTSASVTLP